MLTEEEWLRSEDLPPLLNHLCQIRLNRTKRHRRKFWLFGCACCRRVWDLFEADPVCAEMVVAAERFADGAATFAGVRDCDRRLKVPPSGRSQQTALAARSLAYTNVQVLANGVAYYCAGAASNGLLFPKYTPHHSREIAQAANLLRDIFGNPYRPISFDPAWRTSDVLALAKGIYDDRAFDRMPILADALQDAGCTNGDILNHCRDTATPHARGCWVVDLVLGKA